MFDIETLWAVRDFVERGGSVMLAIAVLTSVMWILIVERYIYFRTQFRGLKKKAQEVWESRPDHSSWNSHQVRRMLISKASVSLRQRVGLIKTLVALCPMFGLLGTVTGMIEVFDVMALAGSGNARGMASGVSKATLPTMAGMVAAISGMLFVIQIDRTIATESSSLADSLEIERES